MQNACHPAAAHAPAVGCAASWGAARQRGRGTTTSPGHDTQAHVRCWRVRRAWTCWWTTTLWPSSTRTSSPSPISWYAHLPLPLCRARPRVDGCQCPGNGFPALKHCALCARWLRRSACARCSVCSAAAGGRRLRAACLADRAQACGRGSLGEPWRRGGAQTQTVPYLIDNPEVGYVQTRWVFVNPDESYLTKARRSARHSP